MSWLKPPAGPLTEHFTWAEAACNHCGLVPSVAAVRQSAAMMERVRAICGDRPIHVTSWCRCPVYNAAVDGVPGSYHLLGLAVDISVTGLAPAAVQAALWGHRDIARGLGCYPTFTHVDCRQSRSEWALNGASLPTRHVPAPPAASAPTALPTPLELLQAVYKAPPTEQLAALNRFSNHPEVRAWLETYRR